MSSEKLDDQIKDPNGSTASLTTSSTSPPPTVTLDIPSILQSIDVLNLRLVTKCPEDLGHVARSIQAISSIPLKSITISNGATLHKLHSSKSDYWVFLKHESKMFDDLDAYISFIPSMQELTIMQCPHTSRELKESIKEWELQESACPVRKLLCIDAELPHHEHPNVIFIPKVSDEQLEKALQESMADIEGMETIDSPKALDDNLPKQVRHRLKSRVKGRAQKLLADIYLLFGHHQEALSLYSKAIDDCKLNSDIVWQVAAQEGHAVASFLKSVYSEEARKSKYVKQAAEGLCSKLHDLSSGYERAALVFLAFRTILQASRLFKSLGMSTEYHYYLSSTCDLLPSMPGEEFEHALSVIMQSYEESGLPRKKALLAQQLAQHYFTNGRVPLAISILESCCFPQMSITVRGRDSNWNRLAYQLTRTALDMVRNTQDRSLQLLYSLLHLKYGRPFLGEKQQKELLGTCEALARDLPIMEPRSIAQLCCPKLVTAAEITSGLTIINATKTNTFITDIRRLEPVQTKGVVLVNQTFAITIEFTNPFSCDLLIKNFTLHSSNSSFICESQSFELAFNSKHTITLNASVTDESTLEQLHITKATYSLFNVTLQEDVLIPAVKVYPEQPFVKVIDSSVKTGCLSLYEGERTSLKLRLLNTSQRTAHKLHVTPKYSFPKAERSLNSLLFRKQESPIISLSCSKASLEPGEEAAINLELCAVLGLNSLEVVVSYQGEEAAMPRSFYHNVIITVQETFTVEEAAILPFDPFGKHSGPVLAFTLYTTSFDAIDLQVLHGDNTITEHTSIGETSRKIVTPIDLLKYPQSFQDAVNALDLDDNKSALLNKIRNRDISTKDFTLEAFWATLQTLSPLSIRWHIKDQERKGSFDIEEWMIPKHQLPLVYHPLFFMQATVKEEQLVVSVEGRAMVRVQFYDRNQTCLYLSAEENVYLELQDESRPYRLPSSYNVILICATCPITRRNQFIEIKAN